MARGFRLVARGAGDLKTRYRPQKLSEAAPTFPITRLKKILTDPNASQVYLFEGLTGTGKTSCSRILSRAAVCTEDNKPCLTCDACMQMDTCGDFFEVNVANYRTIDDMRELVDGMRFHPTYLNRKIYVLDEVHQLTPASQQLLLKVLEEPPQHVLIFLCTTEKTGLKRTLLDRCETVTFKRLTRAHAMKVVEQVLGDHGVVVDDAIKSEFFSRADGSVRALLNLLQSYIAGDFETGVTEEEEAAPDVVALATALIAKDWRSVSSILQSQQVKKNPETLRIGVTNYLRAITLRRSSPDLAVATPFGQLCGVLDDPVPIERYNRLVLKCLRACHKK